MLGDTLWTPPDDLRETTQIGRFMTWLAAERELDFDGYDALWRWSVDDLEGFWSAIAEFFEVRFHTPYERVLAERTMPGAKWFAGARLNYAEHLVGRDQDLDRSAVVGRSQTRPQVELTFGELREEVSRVRAGLQRLGVVPGDRVAAYMPNIPETLIAFIATASLGATWSACSSEFGPRSVIDRFSQIEPKVLLVVPGYGYRDRYVSRQQEITAIREGLPSLEHVVAVPYGSGEPPADAVGWEELRSLPGPLEFAPVAFDHPLYVLFSSGTTGLPKAIVHGHGGQLLEHQKNQGLFWDLKPGGRLMWFSTTAWMMWNALVSALLMRASIVMLDGDPTWPDLLEQWRIAEQLRPTTMGVSSVYMVACRKAGLRPGRQFDLGSMRVFCTAGSPVPAEAYRWVYESFDPSTLLINGSGGTDICSGMVGGSPAQPVYEGEMSGPSLGVDVKAFDADGNVVVGELGEMVITSPLPSMPVALWGDADGRRYRDAYFDRYPGVWRQGDWIMFTERGSCVVTGRSDATLNRGGVRLGTGEFYRVVEELPEVADSLVVHLEDDAGGSGQLLLFIVAADGDSPNHLPDPEPNHLPDPEPNHPPGPEPNHPPDQALEARIAAALRMQLSPRHVPDRIVTVPAIPRTLTGKKLEAPVKRILRGEPAEQVASRGSLLNPTALDAFVALAEDLARAPRI